MSRWHHQKDDPKKIVNYLIITVINHEMKKIKTIFFLFVIGVLSFCDNKINELEAIEIDVNKFDCVFAQID